MLHTAGFDQIETTDLTADYRATQIRWIAATHAREPEIRQAMGDAAYEERMANRHQTLAAIDKGLLARFQYSARRA